MIKAQEMVKYVTQILIQEEMVLFRMDNALTAHAALMNLFQLANLNVTAMTMMLHLKISVITLLPLEFTLLTASALMMVVVLLTLMRTV